MKHPELIKYLTNLILENVGKMIEICTAKESEYDVKSILLIDFSH